ncbi:hypothetical protein ACOSP7_009893 [Xanthoceras sorbifolium]
MFDPSVVVGSAAYPSSSQGLGLVMKEYLKQAPMLYKEFLTRGLSQLIEEDEGPDLRHTLVRHALLTANLSYKIMLESDDNDAKRRVLRDEILKMKLGLTIAKGREKGLAAELEKLRAREKALEMELKESAATLNEKHAEAERARGNVAQA